MCVCACVCDNSSASNAPSVHLMFVQYCMVYCKRVCVCVCVCVCVLNLFWVRTNDCKRRCTVVQPADIVRSS